ncbi:MAG: RNA methyltransferase [Planctomycetes bacterium]|nr:RNA methyltransferase [Planctomycetota bacterium]
MRIERITSRQNERLKRVRAARDGRDETSLFFEGLKLVREALDRGVPPDLIVVTDSFARDHAWLVDSLTGARQGIIQVAESLMSDLSSVPSPPGIILLARRAAVPTRAIPSSCTFAVVLHKVQDPGNLGSILRSAEAAGVEAAVVTAQSADALSPKALRASMGAVLRLPLWLGPTLAEVVQRCRQLGLTILAAEPRGRLSLWKHDWTSPCAILLGSEGSGFLPDELSLAEQQVSIPMADSCESLNVAAAAAVLFFEAARQRRSCLSNPQE